MCSNECASHDRFRPVKIKLLGWLGPETKAALPALTGIVTTNSLTRFASGRPTRFAGLIRQSAIDSASPARWLFQRILGISDGGTQRRYARMPLTISPATSVNR